MTSTTRSSGSFWKKKAEGSPSRLRALASKKNGFQDFDDDMSEAWSTVEDDLILAHTPKGPSPKARGARTLSSSSASSATATASATTTTTTPTTAQTSSHTSHDGHAPGHMQPQQRQPQQREGPHTRADPAAPADKSSWTPHHAMTQEPQSVLQTDLHTVTPPPARSRSGRRTAETGAPSSSLASSASTATSSQPSASTRTAPADHSSSSTHDDATDATGSEAAQARSSTGGMRYSSNARADVVPESVTPVTRFRLPGDVKTRAEMKIGQFEKALNSGNIDIDKLKQLSWSGVPAQVRPMVWRLLCGYLPANLERRQATLERKRVEYKTLVDQYYQTRLDPENKKTFHQIQIDVPRTCPEVATFQQPVLQEMLERILYIWAIRHPGSGYVQGMNDLATPFVAVFMDEVIDCDFAECDASTVPAVLLQDVEADCFWCLSRLLDGIQDNYTTAQPGIHSKIARLEEVMQRVDRPLLDHLRETGVMVVQFAFRWINCLLMRELPLHCTIRLWDTCLSEKDGFSSFHVYVCAAFLKMFSKQLQARDDFQSLLCGLQNLPTSNWTFDEIELVLAEAFTLQSVFSDSKAHLSSTAKP